MVDVLLTFMNTLLNRDGGSSKIHICQGIIAEEAEILYCICETFVDLLFAGLNERLEDYDLSMYMVRRIDLM